MVGEFSGTTTTAASELSISDIRAAMDLIRQSWAEKIKASPNDFTVQLPDNSVAIRRPWMDDGLAVVFGADFASRIWDLPHSSRLDFPDWKIHSYDPDLVPPVTGNTLTVPRRIVEAIYSGSQYWMEEMIITDQTPQITIA